MAKCYDDDGHGKDVGLRLPLPAVVIMAAIALPPQTDRQTSNDKEERHGAKLDLRRVMIRSSIVCVKLININTQRYMYRAGCTVCFVFLCSSTGLNHGNS